MSIVGQLSDSDIERITVPAPDPKPSRRAKTEEERARFNRYHALYGQWKRAVARGEFKDTWQAWAAQNGLELRTKAAKADQNTEESA